MGLSVRVAKENGSLEGTSIIRWKCSAQIFQQVLHLLCQRQVQLMLFLHYQMKVPPNKAISLKLTCKDQTITEEVNRLWSFIVRQNFERMLKLDSLIWHLSTFGGAFSSMGDYDKKWAAKAGAISIEQLKLAKEIGNETLVARCYLYIALSDAQLGRVKEAKHVARTIYIHAVWTKNELLEKCSQGVFYKIRDISRYLKTRYLE